MTSTHNIDSLKHTHIFDEGNPLAERNTRWAVYLTVVMMIAEISGGWIYNSMALLADGWHMSSHALALGLSVFAYAAARRLANDKRFAFGTWKIEVLSGFASALFLVGIAALMLFQSVERLLSPQPIHYNEAISIAALGLLVNLICAWLLKDDHHHHGHDNGHHHGHDHSHDHHQDLNLRAAYIHVLTDAATSVLAIIALFGGKLWGADWLDPVMGIVGAGLVAIWAVGLLKETGRVLLDAEMDAPVVEEVREVIADIEFYIEITDLHVWRVGKGKYSCILAVACAEPLSPDFIREKLSIHEELVHVTVEINPL
ncbi:CDF family Co(II)/Ni(II) efflux transporter DmeF [Thalassolituus sp.]|uniref:CDF family Co(II)/Ni(II) efflux transporter DmeF n=1 Tax=Thalassolituus sp. TaxID=2030822 RepID=UPI002A80FF1B|nr:CDF family Co(II)/Ni(II) efflux transporter DmeF [Thalassolituus sp.]